MKVCMIVPYFFPHVGGGEQLYYDIASSLIKEGHEVRVITSLCDETQGYHKYENIDVYYCKWKILFNHPLVKKGDLIEHVKWCDIVHTTVFTTSAPASKLAKKYHKPSVITIHEVIGDKWNWFISNPILAYGFRMFEKYACTRKFDAYHVVSDSTKKDYIKYYGSNDKLIRIYNSVHLPDISKIDQEKITLKDYFNLKEDDITFLYFGRPAPNKGIFVLEEALNILNKEYSIPSNIKFCLLCALEPSDSRKKLISLINQHNLNDKVIIKESVKRNELFKIIRDANYVIIPSITEGFGFCAVESCSLEKKVIYSSGGSLPEVVYGDVLEFENMNSNDLAKKIFKVINEKNNSFNVIEKKDFSSKKMTNSFIKLYKNIV